MKLLDALLLGVAAAFMMIGIHQMVMNSWLDNYWIIMLSIGCFAWYLLRKNNRKQDD